MLHVKSNITHSFEWNKKHYFDKISGNEIYKTFSNL